jgi:hypothetical protein
VIERTKRLRIILKAGGWQLISAKTLGAPGRMKALHRRKTTKDDAHDQPAVAAA